VVSPIRAVLFDLDNCLAPADAPGRELLDPMFAAIRAAADGHLSPAALERAFADCWSLPFDQVAHRHGFSAAMLEAAWRVAVPMRVTRPISGYHDLSVLAELDAIRILVTTGFRQLQESKVDALGFRHLFTSVHVDAIDEAPRLGKESIFAAVLAAHRLRPGEALVVGDSATSEIAAGNALGIPTVQILRPGVVRARNAGRHVHGLAELIPVLSRSLLPNLS
jgi:FMN phosphatase YigB (HAD superfamily)